METDPDRPVEAPHANPGEVAPPRVGTMVWPPGDPQSQPGTPRSQPLAPASAHPSGMWFCPMRRCARREGASHLRSVHLSAGSTPPDSWLQAHNLRVCLACHELSAVGSRCPGPRCSSAVWAALAAGNAAPTAQTRSPLAGSAPPGLDILSLLATLFPTLRRVPIAGSSSCALALTCLLQAVDRKQTWEALARLLLFLRIELASPTRGGKTTRSSSTQHCRLNCLSSVLDPLKELVARLRRASPADGPRTRAVIRAAASEAPDPSSQASDRTAAAVRALLAEGSPGRVLQLMTSDGVCDKADPTVLACLRELHPQTDGPGLETCSKRTATT